MKLKKISLLWLFSLGKYNVKEPAVAQRPELIPLVRTNSIKNRILSIDMNWIFSYFFLFLKAQQSHQRALSQVQEIQIRYQAINPAEVNMDLNTTPIIKYEHCLNVMASIINDRFISEHQ